MPVSADLVGTAIAGLEPEWLDRFAEGDALFDAVFRETQGLGPAYIRTACGSCHTGDGRGAGTVQKMALVDQEGTPLLDQSALPWGHTTRPFVAGGAETPILPPEGAQGLLLTTRAPPPVLGRGYIDAVLDSEMERVAEEQAARGDAIRGRVNYVAYQSHADPANEFHSLELGDLVAGRFGLKARIGTADDFTADAYQGDMSITSPFRPDELLNPDALIDDLLPGEDIDNETVQTTANYMRMLAIPTRTPSVLGEQIFADTGCATCHSPTLRTRGDYPIPQLAGIEAPIYSDLLLHDMGADLQDGLVDGEAGVRDWKTTPLIGLRFQPYFLHDGRAATVEEAVTLHGAGDSEAAEVIATFESLSESDRTALLNFVNSL